MKYMGVWIDHRQARIFEVKDAKSVRASEISRIHSAAEEFGRSGSGHMTHMPPHGVGGSGDAQHHHSENRRAHELAEFYGRVRHTLKDADTIVIIGPGPARDELAATLDADRHFEGRVRRVHSADTHLTDAQVAARVTELLLTP